MKYLILVLLLSACAPAPISQNSVSATPRGPKGVHSNWTHQVTDGNLDLTDSLNAKWSYYTGDKCESDYLITWFNDADQGTISFSNSHSTAVGNLNCSALDGTFEYVLTGTETLQFCQNGNFSNCQEYK